MTPVDRRTTAPGEQRRLVALEPGHAPDEDPAFADADRQLGGFECDVCGQSFRARGAPLVGLSSPDHAAGIRSALLVCPECRPSGPSNWSVTTVYKRFLLAALGHGTRADRPMSGRTRDVGGEGRSTAVAVPRLTCSGSPERYRHEPTPLTIATAAPELRLRCPICDAAVRVEPADD